MRRLIILAATALALSTAPLAAASASMRASVAHELPRYVQGVEVDALPDRKVAAIYMLIHGDRSESDKRNLIRSTLGGRNTLRGLLFGS